MNHARCNPVIQQASGTISRAIGLENGGRAARIPHRMKTPKLILINTPVQRGVHRPLATGNRFNGFGTARKTVETVPTFVRRSSTPLKWGVNQKVFSWVWLVAGGRRLSRVLICSLLAI